MVSSITTCTTADLQSYELLCCLHAISGFVLSPIVCPKGIPGTGKSWLMQHMAQATANAYPTAIVAYHDVTSDRKLPIELIRVACETRGLTVPESTTTLKQLLNFIRSEKVRSGSCWGRGAGMRCVYACVCACEYVSWDTDKDRTFVMLVPPLSCA